VYRLGEDTSKGRVGDYTSPKQSNERICPECVNWPFGSLLRFSSVCDGTIGKNPNIDVEIGFMNRPPFDLLQNPLLCRCPDRAGEAVAPIGATRRKQCSAFEWGRMWPE
jgi:hypothetical protein